MHFSQVLIFPPVAHKLPLTSFLNWCYIWIHNKQMQLLMWQTNITFHTLRIAANNNLPKCTFSGHNVMADHTHLPLCLMLFFICSSCAFLLNFSFFSFCFGACADATSAPLPSFLSWDFLLPGVLPASLPGSFPGFVCVRRLWDHRLCCRGLHMNCPFIYKYSWEQTRGKDWGFLLLKCEFAVTGMFRCENDGFFFP